MLCFPANKSYKTCCCGLPLGFGTIVLGVLIGCMGILSAVEALRSHSYLDLVLGVVSILSGVCAVYSSLVRSELGLSLLLMALNVIVILGLVWVVITLVVLVTIEIVADTDAMTLIFGVAVIVLAVVTFSVMRWFESIVASHIAVLKAGGTGWEQKPYVEIREEQACLNEEQVAV